MDHERGSQNWNTLLHDHLARGHGWAFFFSKKKNSIYLMKFALEEIFVPWMRALKSMLRWRHAPEDKLSSFVTCVQGISYF